MVPGQKLVEGVTVEAELEIFQEYSSLLESGFEH